jgi:hypothetical protein
VFTQSTEVASDCTGVFCCAVVHYRNDDPPHATWGSPFYHTHVIGPRQENDDFLSIELSRGTKLPIPSPLHLYAACITPLLCAVVSSQSEQQTRRSALWALTLPHPTMTHDSTSCLAYWFTPQQRTSRTKIWKNGNEPPALAKIWNKVSHGKSPLHNKHKCKIFVQMNLSIHVICRAMAQVVSRRPLTAEARVRARVNPCGICGQSGTGTGFSPSYLVFPCQY